MRTITPFSAPAVRGRPKDTAKRDGIVRAAGHLFFKDGYVLTSMDAVARKANVSKLTIYSHFANKDELFKAVVRQRCDARAMPDCFVTLSDKPVERAVPQIAARMIEILYSPESLHLHRLMQGEAAHHPKVVRMFYEAGPQRVREAFSNLLRYWQRQGQLTIPDVERATEQFFSLLKGEFMAKTLMFMTPAPNAAALRKHARATASFFLAAYQPKSPTGAP